MGRGVLLSGVVAAALALCALAPPALAQSPPAPDAKPEMKEGCPGLVADDVGRSLRAPKGPSRLPRVPRSAEAAAMLDAASPVAPSGDPVTDAVGLRDQAAHLPGQAAPFDQLHAEEG